MKIKKILSALLIAVLAIQCTSFTSFAEEAIVFDEPENVLILNQENTDDYGYIDYKFVDENGKTVDLNPEYDPSEIPNSISTFGVTESTLPTKYSLKDLGLVTEAKEQGKAQSCWAFSALGSLESNLLVQGKGAYDFSEAHLVWFAQRSATMDTNSPLYGDGIIRSDPYGSGGHWLYATSALSKWSGTTNESDYPFYPSATYKMGNYPESERFNTSGGIILNSAESLHDLSSIKTWIMENGAVEATYYTNPEFYNMTSKTCAYYCDDKSLIANHSILIVGWDDYYSPSNFKSSLRPAASGAFLCKNSWGADWGENGYFWISYYDQTIGSMTGYTGVDADTYTNNYTYNGLGWGAAFSNTSVNGAQVANVFTSKGYESLSAVSTYTVQDDVHIEVFVYRNLPKNYSRPNQGTLVYSSKKTLFANGGYHTIPIETPVSLNPDEIFSVVIRLSTDADKLYVPAEYDEGTNNYSCKARQSYIDTFGTGSYWIDTINSEAWDNVCVQAFTVCEHQIYSVTTPSTCETNGNISNYCSQCNKQVSHQMLELEEHTFGEWVTTKSSTTDSEGEKTRTCEICCYSEKQFTPCTTPKITAKTVTPNQFAEILKSLLESIIIRIAERFGEKGVRCY